MPSIVTGVVPFFWLFTVAFTLFTMTAGQAHGYAIGTPLKPWGASERAEWLKTRAIQRSYDDEVLAKLNKGFEGFDTHQYGTLEVDAEGDAKKSYPLFAVKSHNWDDSKPCFLLTGGVHGYEKSGVQGAILFLSSSKALEYSKKGFNILVLPCVSPWGYETNQRWNSRAVDPNRSFNPNGEVVEGRSFNPEAATDESAALIKYLDTLGVKQWMCHIDLHETTDSDQTEFRPAKRARDGLSPESLEEAKKADPIPDGFYLVSDSTNPQTAWHKAMIDSVRKVTHIAPAEADGTMIGEKVVQDGVIAIPAPKSLGLCAGVTNAFYATTTEVYPDSPSATEEQCNQAQVACIEGGLQCIMQEQSVFAECAAQEVTP